MNADKKLKTSENWFNEMQQKHDKTKHVSIDRMNNFQSSHETVTNVKKLKSLAMTI
jgi:hypothetical protein